MDGIREDLDRSGQWLGELGQFPDNMIKPQEVLDGFPDCSLSDDEDTVRPASLTSQQKRLAMQNELNELIQFVDKRRKRWLIKISKVEALPATSVTVQNMRSSVVQAMKVERNRLKRLADFLVGKAPIAAKLAKRTQYEIVDTKGVLEAMEPKFSMVVSGATDELQSLREEVFAYLFPYDDMHEPYGYYYGVAQRFLLLHDKANTVGVNEYEKLKGRMGGLSMAQLWWEKYIEASSVYDDIYSDPTLMLGVIKTRMNQYRMWFMNHQTPEYAALLVGGRIQDFVQKGLWFIEQTKGMSENQMVHWLNIQTCFDPWNENQNYFHDFNYYQTFWVMMGAPYVIRMKQVDGQTEWTLGYVKEHPYRDAAGNLRSIPDAIDLLKKEDNELMKFVSDDVVSGAVPARYRVQDSRLWRFFPYAPVVHNHTHKRLTP